METLYIGNDHSVGITSLQDQDGNPITSGTVSGTLYEASVSFGEHTKGNAVSGGTFSLSHDGNGEWSGILDSGVSLTHGEAYFLTVTATIGATVSQWDILCRARWRQ